jgi:hypothetical protein
VIVYILIVKVDDLDQKKKVDDNHNIERPSLMVKINKFVFLRLIQFQTKIKLKFVYNNLYLPSTN